MERGAAKRYLGIEDARRNSFRTDWNATIPPLPQKPGITVLENVTAGTLRHYIDWTPFFQTWELHGRYPEILSDPKVGTEATRLFADANAMLERIEKEKLLGIRGVAGLFPASSNGDDIEVYTDETHTALLGIIHTLRQQQEKPEGEPNLALADFLAPKESGLKDHIGGFAVTTGLGIKPILEQFREAHDDYSAILLQALADRLAEAFAEMLHEKVRRELWGYAPAEILGSESLISENYQGIRPAPGYPACPDHTEKAELFALLNAEANTGITLTETYAMNPAASVSGLYFASPEARYFVLGKIQKDQVEDYAGRKGLSLLDAEKWLAPNLAYEP
jgi:5-methyltetrahydrofolate--homocysteine methyltransferase